MKNRVNFKEELRNEWIKKKFKLLFITTILLVISLIFRNFLGIRSIFVIFSFWLLAFFLYERLDKEIWSQKNDYQKGYFYFIFSINVLFFLLLAFLAFDVIKNVSPTFTILTLITSFGVFLAILVAWQFFSFLYSSKSDSLRWIIINYIFLAFIIILFFGFVFAISSGSTENALLLSFNNSEITDPGNIIYFSSVTFYSLGYGDIRPVGFWTKLISQLEVGVGFIFHVIILGNVISTSRNKNMTKKKK